jgi:hypothetical protein
MRTSLSGKDTSYILAGIVVLLALVLLVTWARRSKYEDQRWLKTVFQQTVQKNQLVDTIGINLLASAEAEKSAVMANTDEASQELADQSVRASQAVDKARRELGLLIEGQNNRREIELFSQFSSCWEKLQEVDREILPLAVQNTNLKALRLSFVPAREALERMAAALNQLMDASASSPDALGITRLASAAIIAALNIYALEAPHIAETTEAQMNQIEAAMQRLDAPVMDALNSLQAQAGATGKPFVDAAWTSYKDFQKINSEIIELSRQNSNVRSFAMSLGQKRNLMAQCQDLLTALQEAIQSTNFKATR